MVGERALQRLVNGTLARHHAAGRAGNAVTVDGILGGGDDFRMPVQSEIIVTRKIQQRAAIDLGMRGGVPVMHSEIRILQSEFLAIVRCKRSSS